MEKQQKQMQASHQMKQRGIYSRPPLGRMHYIVSELQAGKYPNCATLAEELDVSAKTIQRDIEYLKYSMDAPIEYDASKKGYYLTETTWQLQTVPLSETEWEAMRIAEKILERYRESPVYETVQSVFNKFFEQVTPLLSPRAENALFSFEPPPSSSVDKEVFRSVQEAAKERKKLKMRYYTAYRNEQTERVVHPYHLRESMGAWYLIAYCEMRQQVLTFAMNRIQTAERLDEDFTVREDFNLEEFLETAFLMLKGNQRYTVKIRFSPYQARWIRERQWHPTQQVEEQPDGALVLSFDVESLEAARFWVLKYGAEAEVLEPEELRQLIRQELSRMIALYSHKPETNESQAVTIQQASAYEEAKSQRKRSKN